MTEIAATDPTPALDPELLAPLAALHAAVPGGAPSLDAAILPFVRAGFPGVPEPAIEHFARSGRFRVEHTFAPGRESTPDVPLLACTPAGRESKGCIFYIHGGGMVLGSNVNGVDEMLDYAEALDLSVVSVEYRLAPENPHPAPVNDCWTGLRWTIDNADDLGFGRGPVIIAGESAGGGLAAATALVARDHGDSPLRGQLLIAPMLDHRSSTRSMRSIGDATVWTRESNVFGWSSLLGQIPAGEIPPYASPTLAGELADLPPTYIDVGGADAFRDESLDYGSRIAQAGGLVDLHVWAGAYHGFDGMAPTAHVSQTARATRQAWLARVLATPASASSLTSEHLKE